MPASMLLSLTNTLMDILYNTPFYWEYWKSRFSLVRRPPLPAYSDQIEGNIQKLIKEILIVKKFCNA